MTIPTSPPKNASADPLARMRALTGELLARDGWSRARLLAFQRERLRTLLEHAVSASPYYREALGADAAERALQELPTLSKATFVDQWDRIACDPALKLAAVEAHVAGPAAASPLDGRFRAASTSGASGLRGLFVYGPEEWMEWVAACLRCFSRLGIGPGTRMVGIASPHPAHLSKQAYATLGAGRDGSPALSALTPLPESVRALNGYQPEALMGYPSVTAQLADEQLAGRLHIQPRVAICTSEPLTDDVRARVRAAWGIEPNDVYATTEALFVAASAPEHPRTLEIPEDLVVVEVVDERDRPVPPGVPGAKVLLTTLTHRGLPLIRYEVTDRVTLAPSSNPGGRPYACLAAVEGRTADTLHLPAGSGGVVEVLPYRLAAPYTQLPDVRQFQILWDGERMTVRIVPRPSATADTPERVRAALGAALADAGARPIPLQIVTAVTELEREPGPAAKLKLIVNREPRSRPHPPSTVG